MENKVDNEVSSDQILGYLKSKYLSKPEQHATNTPETTSDDNKANKLPVGKQSDFSGENAENNYLLTQLENVQTELSKWLDILKSKIRN